MNDITKLLRDDTLARILMDSVPFGLFIVDGDGRVMAVNNMLERVLGVTEQTIVGKGSGETLGCLHASEAPEGCGSGEYCKDCECRKLALTAISQNQKRNANVYFQLIIDGQVRDLTLLASAAPFTFNNKRFAVLIITDITRLSSMSPPDTYNGFRGIVGRDEKMQELFDTIRQVARTDAPVLIQGETGTGKELVALAIHKESPRARASTLCRSTVAPCLKGCSKQSSLATSKAHSPVRYARRRAVSSLQIAGLFFSTKWVS